jgi:hypothetical protein
VLELRRWLQEWGLRQEWLLADALRELRASRTGKSVQEQPLPDAPPELQPSCSTSLRSDLGTEPAMTRELHDPLPGMIVATKSSGRADESLELPGGLLRRSIADDTEEAVASSPYVVVSKQVQRRARESALFRRLDAMENKRNSRTIDTSLSRTARLSRTLCEQIRSAIDEPPPPRHGFLSDVVESKNFERIVLLVILTNAFYIGLHCDHAMENRHDEAETLGWRIGETIFASFYIIELCMRIAVHRFHFFFCYDWRWNMLDVVIVVLHPGHGPVVHWG